MEKKISFLISLIASLFAIYSCGTKEPKVESLNLREGTLYLLRNESKSIELEVLPAHVPVLFKAENEAIATVSDKGVVTAKALGETRIFLTAQHLKKEVKVVVLEDVHLRYLSKALLVGDTFTLPVEPKEAVFNVTADKSGIVEVKGNEITVKAEGEVTLTLSKGDKQETFSLFAFSEVDYSKATWEQEFLVGDPIEWSPAMVLSAEKALGLRENVGYGKKEGKEFMLFSPKDGVTPQQLLFGSAIYHLNQGPWTRVIYNCTEYPIKLEDGRDLAPLSEGNANDWVALFYHRYPKLIYVMQMFDPEGENFYGLFFSHDPVLPTASLSLMIPHDKSKAVTHFVVCTLPADE